MLSSSPSNRSEHFGELQAPRAQTIAANFDLRAQLNRFEQRFPRELGLFRAVGIHPDKSPPLLDPYTQTYCALDFRNIGEHCLAVAYCSEKISQSLLDARIIDRTDFDFIVQRALIHDLAKPFEIMRRDAARANLLTDVYSSQAYTDLGALLSRNGMTERDAQFIANSGTETSHHSLLELMCVDAQGNVALCQGRLPQKVIFLADEMTFTSIPEGGERPVTLFLSFAERMRESHFVDRYPFLFKEGIALDAQGHFVPIKDVMCLEPGVHLVGSYAELETSISTLICKELQTLLSRNPELDPSDSIKNLINGLAD